MTETKYIGNISDSTVFSLGFVLDIFAILSCLLPRSSGVLSILLAFGGVMIMGFVSEEGSYMQKIGNVTLGIMAIFFLLALFLSLAGITLPL
jgi:succinate dehydrogenase hydrophobic anchor subunit